LLCVRPCQAVPLVQEASASKDQKGDEAAAVDVLEKYITAIGGRPDATRTRFVETEQEVELFGNVRTIYRLQEEPKGRFYERTEAADGVTEQGFDGKRVWTKTAYQRGYLAANDPAARRLLSRAHTLLDYKESGQKFARLPNEKVGDKDCFVLKSTLADTL